MILIIIRAILTYAPVTCDHAPKNAQRARQCACALATKICKRCSIVIFKFLSIEIIIKITNFSFHNHSKSDVIIAYCRFTVAEKVMALYILAKFGSKSHWSFLFYRQGQKVMKSCFIVNHPKVGLIGF